VGVEIRLLGGFTATVDGTAVGDGAWRLKKSRELVKLLALAPRHRVHREQAMDVLWRDRAPAAAANNLNQAVHVARRVLGPDALQVRDGLVELDADVDIDGFRLAGAEARRAGTRDAYRAALSLYGGELLPENRYDDWASETREELDELQAELSATLGRLAEERIRYRLPAEASSFVGRGHELAELRALLGRTRLLTLTGTGGTGKTRLALELARGVEQSYADGGALVELATVTRPAQVTAAVAAALDVQVLPDQPARDALVEVLAARTLLLVLDNCEHVLGASAALADALLRGAPGVTILATSREPTRVPGEVVFRVPSLAIPDPERVASTDDLLGFEAVRLFVERAAAASPGFALDDENRADVARICFRLDGLPLALELAAARLGALGPNAVAERLDDRFRLLRAGGATAPTRQQTLEATLAWSHELLEEDERILFRRLAVFAGGFELDAVEQVCAGDADVLARLVEKSLVTPDGEGRERRYRLLETVRIYAAQRLDEGGERAELRERHARWALALAAGGDSPRLGRELANMGAALDLLTMRAPEDALELCLALWPLWLRRIDLAEGHERLADALAAAPERTLGRARALLAAASIDYRAGSLARGVAYADESLAIALELGDPWAEWRAVHFFAGVGIADDRADEAESWLMRGRDLAHRHGFAAAEALCVYLLGVTRWEVGDLEGAERYVADSVERFRSLASSPERIPAPVNISEIRTPDADHRPGLRVVFEDTLQPFVEITCDAAVAYALANQAAVARLRGDLERSWALLDESAALFDRRGDRRGIADVAVRRAYVELAVGALPAARENLERSLAERRALDDRRGVGLALSGLGLVEILSGEYEEAERHLAESRDLFRRAGDRWGLAASLWRTADLGLARDRLDDAEQALEEARAVLGETGRLRWTAQTLAALGEVARLRGDPERAATLFAEAREGFAARHDEPGVAAVERRLHALSGR
jgi:predicted ATPase